MIEPYFSTILEVLGNDILGSECKKLSVEIFRAISAQGFIFDKHEITRMNFMYRERNVEIDVDLDTLSMKVALKRKSNSRFRGRFSGLGNNSPFTPFTELKKYTCTVDGLSLTFEFDSWISAIFIRGALDVARSRSFVGLHGKFGRTFSQLLVEKFYTSIQARIGIFSPDRSDELFREARSLYLKNPILFSLSSRLRKVVDGELDLKTHYYQAALQVRSAEHRLEREGMGEIALIPMAEVQVAATNLLKRVLHAHRRFPHSLTKRTAFIKRRHFSIMLNVPGYAINPSNTHFAPSVTVRSGTFVVRFVWHTPQVITVEKRSGIGWRHLFLIGDQEHSFNERDCKKLLRRLRLLDKVLSEAVEEAVHSPFYAAAIADSANRARQFGSAIGRKRRIMPL